MRYPLLPTIRVRTREVPLGPIRSIILQAPTRVAQPLTLLRPLRSREACLLTRPPPLRTIELPLLSRVPPLPSLRAKLLIRSLRVSPLMWTLPVVRVPELTIPVVTGGPLLKVLPMDPLTCETPLLEIR